MSNINLEDEFIKGIMISLKIESNPFITATIKDYVKDVQPHQRKEFMKALFGTQHTYLNGIDRISKVAEAFKPFVVDETEAEAKRLISGVEAMNTILFDEAHKSGAMFEDLVRDYKFENVTDRSMAILNNVKPYCDVKQLVINIRRYQTSKDAISAFKSAIKQANQNNNLAIAGNVRKMIKG